MSFMLLCCNEVLNVASEIKFVANSSFWMVFIYDQLHFPIEVGIYYT